MKMIEIYIRMNDKHGNFKHITTPDSDEAIHFITTYEQILDKLNKTK